MIGVPISKNEFILSDPRGEKVPDFLRMVLERTIESSSVITVWEVNVYYLIVSGPIL